MLGAVTSIGGFLFGYDTVRLANNEDISAGLPRVTGANIRYASLHGFHRQIWPDTA
jgi:hypothetical protein